MRLKYSASQETVHAYVLGAHNLWYRVTGGENFKCPEWRMVVFYAGMIHNHQLTLPAPR